MKKLFTIALCVASLAGGSQAFAAKVYKWVDDEGVTHFSEHPPKNTQTTVIKPKIGYSDPVNYGVDGTVITPKDAGAAATQQKVDEELAQALKDPTRCAAARKNLETLQNFGRIKFKGEDGEFHYLTPEEQQEKIKLNQQAIDESC